jgi:2-dehydropantoate 2-reductase
MQNPNVLIVGAGAVGSYYGGRLSQSGAKVSVLSRSDYEEVKKNGINIQSVNGDFKFIPDEVVKSVSDYSKKPDYIIVTTKVLPELDIVNLIKSQVKKNTSIVLIQNGINIEEKIYNTFPENEIISGLAFICVSKVSPGTILHQDFGRLAIGTYPNGISKKVTFLQNLFNESGVKCLTNENIVNSRWQKLVWNAPFNPLSVILGGATTEMILKNEKTTVLAKKIMQEVVDLAKLSGYELPNDIIEKNIKNTLNMAPYKTSMLLDFENKRPLEVEAILGNTLKIAEENNFLASNLKVIYEILSFLNDNNLK